MNNTVTDLQYLALSAISYSDLPTEKIIDENDQTTRSWTIFDLIDAGLIEDYYVNAVTKEVDPKYAVLASMLDWELVGFQSNTSTGFASAAFQSTSGEVVFAFRGTEPDVISPLNPTSFADDFLTDLQIALGSNGVNQFSDAVNFVDAVLANIDGDVNYSFTGHSLGGWSGAVSNIL